MKSDEPTSSKRKAGKHMTKVNIQRLPKGMYRLSTQREGITLSAQDMRDIYDWYQLHMRELEAEAKEQQGYEDIRTDIEHFYEGEDGAY
jgi:hypothetical protein